MVEVFKDYLYKITTSTKEDIITYFFLIIYIQIFMQRTYKLKNCHRLKLTRPKVYTTLWTSIYYSSYSKAMDFHIGFFIFSIQYIFMQSSTTKNQFLKVIYFYFSCLLWLSVLCSVEVIKFGTLIFFLAWEEVLLVSYYLVEH